MIQGLCDSIQPAFSFFLSLPIKSCHSELRIVILSEAKNLLFPAGGKALIQCARTKVLSRLKCQRAHALSQPPEVYARHIIHPDAPVVLMCIKQSPQLPQHRFVLRMTLAGRV
jgi:hypothetical protein